MLRIRHCRTSDGAEREALAAWDDILLVRKTIERAAAGGIKCASNWRGTERVGMETMWWSTQNAVLDRQARVDAERAAESGAWPVRKEGGRQARSGGGGEARGARQADVKEACSRAPGESVALPGLASAACLISCQSCPKLSGIARQCVYTSRQSRGVARRWAVHPSRQRAPSHFEKPTNKAAPGDALGVFLIGTAIRHPQDAETLRLIDHISADARTKRP